MLTFRNPFKRREITKFIFVHHAAAAQASAKDIHGWHLEKGWSGIGYESVIRSSGSVELGRPHWAEGAQAYGYNHISVGVCLEGDLRVQPITPPQYKSLINKLVELRTIYPEAIILPHSALVSTDCPGISRATFWSMVAEVERVLVEKRAEKKKGLLARFERILKRRAR